MLDQENPISAAIDAVIGLFSGGPVAWPASPDLIEITAVPSAAANKADAAQQADGANPAAARAIWTNYNTQYGWINDAPTGGRSPHPNMPKGDPPWMYKPWAVFDVHDLDAAITISGLLQGARPEHVLALAIMEGVGIVTGARLQGSKLKLTSGNSLAAQVSADQLRAWTRSMYIWNYFGGDEYASHAARGDNVPNGPEADHDGVFLAALQSLRAGTPDNRIGGPILTADLASIVDYTKTSWLRLEFQNITADTVVAINDVKTLPAGTELIPRVLPQDWSLGSWLYLQFALFFCKYRLTMEDLLKTKFEQGVDLSAQPWVTYTGWNGNAQTQVDLLFTNGAAPQEAIDHVFGAHPLELTQAELDAIFAIHGGAALAHPNAVIYKYLCEVMARWFL